MALFDNGDPEDLLLFVHNFKMTLESLETLAAKEKLQYLCAILRGEALCQFDTLFAKVGSTTTTHLNRVVLGLGTYFFPVNEFSKQRCAMSQKMIKPY